MNTVKHTAPVNARRLAETLGMGVVVLDEESGPVIQSPATETAIRAALDGHDGTPDPPEDFDAEFRAAIQGATSIADLKAALLGTRGPGAEPRRGQP